MAGCDQNNGWGSAGPTRLCVDAQNKRLPDIECASGGFGHRWYYLGRGGGFGGTVPGNGQFVGGGSFSPASGLTYGSAPAGGIARGGFGGTAGEGGGGAGE
jgi:hypothetical protein